MVTKYYRNTLTVYEL